MGNVQLKKKRKIPELRFPEFSGEWEEKKLGTISTINKNKKIPDKFFYIDLESVNEGVLDRNLIIYNKNNAPSRARRVISKGDILYSTVRPYQNNNLYIDFSMEMPIVASTGFALIQSKIDNKFIYYYMCNNKYTIEVLKRCTGTSYPAINTTDLLNTMIIYPKNTIEQQKIGNFFYTIDKKLELQEEKIDTLKEYKKGMMQKIFSQEIRFKDDDGKDFPDWEEKRLEDMGEFLTSSVDKKIKENEIIVNLCNYMDVYNRLEIRNNNLDILNKTSATEMQIKNNNLLKGDILITPSSETSDDIGHSVVIWEDLKNTVYSYHLLRFRPHIKMDLKFSNYWFNSEAVRKHFIIRAQGATRFTISINNIKDIIVKYPTIREQEKIGKLLYSIDKKIELEEEKLEKYKKFKKGLMQRMFV